MRSVQNPRISVCLRRRLQPCHKKREMNAALAPEVVQFCLQRLFQHPLQPRPSRRSALTTTRDSGRAASRIPVFSSPPRRSRTTLLLIQRGENLRHIDSDLRARYRQFGLDHSLKARRRIPPRLRAPPDRSTRYAPLPSPDIRPASYACASNRPNSQVRDALDADQHWNSLSLPYLVGPHGRIGILRPSELPNAAKSSKIACQAPQHPNSALARSPCWRYSSPQSGILVMLRPIQ